MVLVVGYCAAALLIFFILRLIFGLAGFSFFLSSKKTTVETSSENAALADEEITGLALKKMSGSAKIVLADVPHATIEAQNMPESFKWKVEDGMLTASCGSEPNFFFHFFNGGRRAPRLTITLPKDAHLTSVSLEGGAGDFTLHDLTADDLTVSMGVGELELKKITAKNSCDFQGGTGDLSLIDCDLNNAKISVGVGDLDLKGGLKGSCRLEGGVGDMELRLSGSESDYQITTESGIGEVELGGSDIKNATVGSADAKNRLHIKSGVGDVEISFSR